MSDKSKKKIQEVQQLLSRYEKLYDSMDEHVRKLQEYFHLNGYTLVESLNVCVNLIISVGQAIDLDKAQMLAMMDQTKDAIDKGWKNQ